jgi:hypothetical protein
MKRMRVRSMDELQSLPDGEWVEVIGPMRWEIEASVLEVNGEGVVVKLPAGVPRKLKGKKGARLNAQYSKGNLVIERARPGGGGVRQ